MALSKSPTRKVARKSLFVGSHRISGSAAGPECRGFKIPPMPRVNARPCSFTVQTVGSRTLLSCPAALDRSLEIEMQAPVAGSRCEPLMNVVQRPAKGGAMLVFATGTLSQCRLTRTGSSEPTLWVTGAAFLITEAERARIAATFPSLDGAKAVRT